MSVNERFEDIIRGLFGGNKAAFAKTIGVSATVIENIVGTRKGNPSYGVIEKVCANANINPSWLVLGEGSMLRTEMPTETSAKPSDGADLGGIDVETMLQTIATQARIIERLQLKIESLEAHQKQNEA